MNPNLLGFLVRLLYNFKTIVVSDYVEELKQEVKIHFQVIRNKLSGKCWHRSLEMYSRHRGHQRWNSSVKSCVLWEGKVEKIRILSTK